MLDGAAPNTTRLEQASLCKLDVWAASERASDHAKSRDAHIFTFHLGHLPIASRFPPSTFPVLELLPSRYFTTGKLAVFWALPEK